MAERVGLRILNHSHLVSIVIVGVRHAPWLVMAFMSVLPRVGFGGWCSSRLSIEGQSATGHSIGYTSLLGSTPGDSGRRIFGEAVAAGPWPSTRR
jgi:hypothetical protein